MPLPKKNKMMILFLSSENKLWELLKTEKIKSPAKQDTILLYCGSLSPMSLSNWKKGRPIEEKSEEKIFGALFKRINTLPNSENKNKATEILEQFSNMYHDKIEHMYRVANVLGISIEDSQKIIDEAIYSRLPLFSKFYTENEQSGQNLILNRYRNYRGVYNLNMRREAFWLQCSLRVRYVIKIRDGLTIRCKLNVPKIQFEKNGFPYWEYDGFFSVYGNHVFWMFEKRDSDRVDYIQFITSLDRIYEQKFGFTGTYLTTGQDDAQTIVSNDVFLERVILDDVDTLEQYMHSSPKVLRSQAETSEAQRLWKGFKSSNGSFLISNSD